jgi:DNA-binding FadR family transcriptional regulator
MKPRDTSVRPERVSPDRPILVRRPTMSDVARSAGCSQATVSFVLNGKPGLTITPELRRRVMEAAHSLGYRSKPPRKPASPESGLRATTGVAKHWEQSLSQTSKVVRELGLAITSSRYPANSILPRDAELMAQFGVSRTVLREALKVLSGKRLLQSRARIGTKVRDRSEWSLFDRDLLMWHAQGGADADFIRYVGEIRWALEPEAAALAARRRKDEDIEILYAHVDRMNVRTVSLQEFVAADLGFHIAVATAAGNPFLQAISALIEVALTAALTKSWPGDRPDGIERSAAEHRAIADAIADRDEDRARDAMQIVIAEGISNVA